MKANGGQLVRGTAHRESLTLVQLAAAVAQNKPGMALMVGVTNVQRADVVTTAEATPQARAANPNLVARSQAYFHWPKGPGILVIDADAPKAAGMQPFTREQIMALLVKHYPPIERAPSLAYDSASGWVFDSALGVQLVGQRGVHHLVGIVDASHAPEAAKVLHLRMVVAGDFWIEISSAGVPRARTVVDAPAASGPERLVFSFGADCGRGLEQRRPTPEVFNEAGELIDTRRDLKITKKLEQAERTAFELKIAEPAIAADIQRIRAAWVAEQVDKQIALHKDRRALACLPPLTPDEEAQARSQLVQQHAHTSASRQTSLGMAKADWQSDQLIILDTGKSVTVDEILDDPDTYDGQHCHDPEEPDYGNNDRRIATIHAKPSRGGRPHIHSHAHGGGIYYLLRAAKSVFKALAMSAPTAAGASITAPAPATAPSTGASVTPNTGSSPPPAPPSPPLATAPAAPIGTKRDATDLANARRLATAYAGEVVYAHGIGWLAWDGHRWAPNKELAERRAHGLSRLIDQEIAALSARMITLTNQGDIDAARERLKALTKHAQRSESRSTIDAALGLFKREVATILQFDAAPDLLNVANGTLDLRAGNLRAPDPADRLTMLANVAFDPAASAPRWLDFIEEITCGNVALARFLQVFIGYTLTGHTREQVMLFALGHGANGKSVLFNTIALMLGDYAVTLPPSAIDASSGSDDERMAARLRGRRVALIEEPREGMPLREGAVKWFTGDDRMTGRLLYQEPLAFWPQHKLVLRANHRPLITGTDDGIWRRILLAQFEAKFEGSRRDMGLQACLAAHELPGILNWALMGAAEWYANGLQVPTDVRAATDAYRSEEDRLAQFFDEHTKAEPGAVLARKTLYDAYMCWAKEQHITRPFGSQRFGKGLERWGSGKGVTVQRNPVSNTSEVLGLHLVRWPGAPFSATERT